MVDGSVRVYVESAELCYAAAAAACSVIFIAAI